MHESGHYTVARALGFETGHCAIVVNFGNAHRGESEITLPVGLRSMSEISAYLERRVMVLYAGALAEGLGKNVIDKKRALKALKEGGEQDHAKVRELVNVIRNIRHPDTPLEDAQKELDAIDHELWNKAAEKVLSERTVISKLATVLVSKVTSYEQLTRMERSEIEAITEFQERFSRPRTHRRS